MPWRMRMARYQVMKPFLKFWAVAIFLMMGLVPVARAQGDGLKLFSLEQFNDHRRKVCSSWQVAQAPLYAKGDMATAAQVAAYQAATEEIQTLQKYLAGQGGNHLALDVTGYGSDQPRMKVQKAKLAELFERMSGARIKTQPPFAREDLNQVQIFINALGNVMLNRIVFSK